MGQEHVNVLIGELLGGKSIQSVQKMPEYGFLSSHEKEALEQVDLKALKDFVTLSEARRSSKRLLVNAPASTHCTTLRVRLSPI